MVSNSNFKAWLVLTSIVTAAAIMVWAAPLERTLGEGIKVVYIHVSLTWAGMLSFILAGIVGIGLLFNTNNKLHECNRLISRVALGWFAAGFVMSLFAAKINWGAVYWNEPRMISSLQFITAAFLVQIITLIVPWPRLQGALSAFLAFFLMWSMLGTPLVLHPGSPIRESSSLPIQLTFLGMFILNFLAVAWFVWHFQKKKSVS